MDIEGGLTFVIGECLTRRDATAKAVSLWYALGVDLLTDLMSMHAIQLVVVLC